ncbi:MAG: sigma-70 family RNA polymerase sigma factor [Dorea sp.]|jgi:RNA polymerase sigma-70 factor (ECF subfamily)|nr:sigma-70 family RNA polymerase sigma factor [Dorea sp.]
MVQLYLSEIIDSQDQEKFEKIYRHYEQKMFSVAYGILRNVQDAEDAVQDAFEALAGNLSRIDGQDVYSRETWAYLMVIVKNKAIHIYNKNKKRKEAAAGDFNLLEELADEFQDIEGKIEQKTFANAIARMVLELPERCRMVLYLHYYNDMSYVEIGRTLGMTESNARQIARRARKIMEKKIVEQRIAESRTTRFLKGGVI